MNKQKVDNNVMKGGLMKSSIYFGRFAGIFAVAVLALIPAGNSFAADKYVIDASHTSTDFSVKHMVITNVKGGFADISGVIMYDEKDISNSSVDVTIKTASINTNNEKRDEHLRSADFFEAEKHPDITFKSKSVTKTDEGMMMVGTLTIKGTSKEVSIPFEITGKVTDPWGSARIGAEGKLTIDRKDYGLTWNKALETGGLLVGNEIKIELNVQAIMEK
jgi:polyisoprenoid-binding protein YceI